jgi:hypothetical protein
VTSRIHSKTTTTSTNRTFDYNKSQTVTKVTTMPLPRPQLRPQYLLQNCTNVSVMCKNCGEALLLRFAQSLSAVSNDTTKTAFTSYNTSVIHYLKNSASSLCGIKPTRTPNRTPALKKHKWYLLRKVTFKSDVNYKCQLWNYWHLTFVP